MIQLSPRKPSRCLVHNCVNGHWDGDVFERLQSSRSKYNAVFEQRIASLSIDSDIEIRAYQPGDEHGLVDLFGRCFGREISLAHWQWKMKSSSVDYENIWVATHRGRPVGQYAGVPVDAWIRGRRRPAIAPVDAMVDPEMRRRGILTGLVIRAHENWHRAGVYFGFGLPNEQWGSRAAALGWVPLFPLRWLLRILRPESVFARRLGIESLARLTAVGAFSRCLLRRAHADAKISVQEIYETHSDFDVIANDARCAEGVQFVRGSNWVDRRYLRCPSADYHVLLAKRGDDPVGYAVYSLRGSTIFQATLTEVITSHDDPIAYSTLVAAVERRCLEKRVETISALSVSGTESWRRLKRCGFFPRRAAFNLQYVPMQPEMQALRSLDEWHFEGGDFDVV